MMTLLLGLHAIAAQRGEGLRPEFLRMITGSSAWADVERMDGASSVENTDDDNPVEEIGKNDRSAEVVAIPLQKQHR
jgi:hypothetical protein